MEEERHGGWKTKLNPCNWDVTSKRFTNLSLLKAFQLSQWVGQNKNAPVFVLFTDSHG